MTPLSSLRLLLGIVVGACAAGSSLAQYKLIGPDGKVTYTDREPTAAEGRVVPLGSRAAAQQPQAADVDLPFELRQPTARYPVTLYTTANACEPCNTARNMLRQRGIPFAERQVISAEDSDALEKLSGGREAPTLTIGAQTLRGFASEVWVSYLDAAGYPRDSKLPSTYAYRPATPIVERAATPARAVPRTAAVTPAAPTTATPAGAGGIRF